jgi:hypothetical protein
VSPTTPQSDRFSFGRWTDGRAGYGFVELNQFALEHLIGARLALSSIAQKSETH